MTVRELIDKLMWLDPNLPVYISDLDKYNGNGSNNHYQALSVDKYIFEDLEMVSLSFKDY